MSLASWGRFILVGKERRKTGRTTFSGKRFLVPIRSAPCPGLVGSERPPCWPRGPGTLCRERCRGRERSRWIKGGASVLERGGGGGVSRILNKLKTVSVVAFSLWLKLFMFTFDHKATCAGLCPVLLLAMNELVFICLLLCLSPSTSRTGPWTILSPAAPRTE